MRKILFGVLIAIACSAGAALTGLMIHDHSSAGKGGSALNAVSLVVPGTLNINTSTGALSSSKACDSGYTRIGPNWCERTTTNTNLVAVPATCTQITLPTGAKALHMAVQVNVFSNNAIGDRLVFWQISGANTCASLGTALQIIGAQVREFVATVGNVLLTTHADVWVPVNTSTGQLWQASVLSGAGASSAAASEIRGYID